VMDPESGREVRARWRSWRQVTKMEKVQCLQTEHIRAFHDRALRRTTSRGRATSGSYKITAEGAIAQPACSAASSGENAHGPGGGEAGCTTRSRQHSRRTHGEPKYYYREGLLFLFIFVS